MNKKDLKIIEETAISIFEIVFEAIDRQPDAYYFHKDKSNENAMRIDGLCYLLIHDSNYESKLYFRLQDMSQHLIEISNYYNQLILDQLFTNR